MKTLKPNLSIITIVIMVLLSFSAKADTETNLNSNSDLTSANAIGGKIIGAIVISALLFYYIRTLIERRKEKATDKYENLKKLARRHNRNLWRRNMYKRECHIINLNKSNSW